MAIESDAQAQEALMASFAEPVAPDYSEATEQAPTPEVTAPQVEAGTTEESDSFTSFDEALLSTLPPEARAVVENTKKSLQGDYTRKMQEIAEQRKQFAQFEGLDPDLARQSVEYVTRLSNDPQFLVQAYENMREALEQAGLSPQEASNQAAATVQAQVDYDDDDDESVVSPQLEARLARLEEWEQKVEQERYQSYLANEALRQEQIIRTENPTYGDDDIGNIVELAWSTGGNLIQAGQKYSVMRDYFARQLLDQKSSVPSTLDPAPANQVAAEAPHKFESLEEAHKAALERWQNIQANQ